MKVKFKDSINDGTGELGVWTYSKVQLENRRCAFEQHTQHKKRQSVCFQTCCIFSLYIKLSSGVYSHGRASGARREGLADSDGPRLTKWVTHSKLNIKVSTTV